MLTPWQRARLGLISYMQRTLAAFTARRLRRYPELRDLLTELQARSQSRAANTADCILLYEAVRHQRPEHILDLGAGDSTAVIAQAAIDAGYAPTICGIEENEQWLEHHRRIIPARLQTSIELLRLDTATTKTQDGVRAVHYLNIPKRAYGLIHVDGPQLLDHGVTESCDIINLLPDLAAKCMVVFDGRESSARLSKPHLERADFKQRRRPPMFAFVFTRDG